MVIKMRKRQKIGLSSVKINSDIQRQAREVRLTRRKAYKEAWCNRDNFYTLQGCKRMFRGYKTEKQIIARYKKFKA